MELGAEERRLRESRTGARWRRWGPYLSERQWGTVREDYSDNGDAWSLLHPRPGAVARVPLGRGRARRRLRRPAAAVPRARAVERARPDPQGAALRPDQRRGQPRRGRQGVLLLRRRPADALVPAVAVQVPAAAFPYDELVATNRRSAAATSSSTSCSTPASSTTTATSTSRSSTRRPARTSRSCRITVHNRGPEDAPLHVLPTLWFRNTWSWAPRRDRRPSLERSTAAATVGRAADHHELGRATTCTSSRRRRAAVLRQRDQRRAALGRRRTPRRTEGRHQRRTSSTAQPTPSNPASAAPRPPRTYASMVPAGGRSSCGVRLDRRADRRAADAVRRLRRRRRRAPSARPTSSTTSITPPALERRRARVMRQALAGMLWSKQYYYFDVDRWLREHAGAPAALPAHRGTAQRGVVPHANDDVISMPDKWEYPWYAAWDLAFHASRSTMVDPDFAKAQLELMLSPRVPPPQRPDPRLRVELRRREPAGARLRHVLVHHLAAGDERRRRPTSTFLERVVPQAAAQLHVVGQPQGPERPQRVRGRLPRARQHRRVRPQRAAADGRPPRAGRRHRVDGAVQPEHARARPRARRARPGVRGLHRQVLRDGSSGSPRRSTRSATTPTRCGTRRTASSTTCSASPTAAGAAQGALAGRAAAAVRDDVSRPTSSSGSPTLRASVARVPRAQRRPARRHRRPAQAGRQRPPAALARQRGQAAPDPRRACSTRSGSSARTASARSRSGTSTTRTRSTSRAPSTGCSTSRPSRRRACSAATPTGAGRCGSRSTCCIIRALLQHYQYYGDGFTIECPTGSGRQMTLFEVAKEISRPARRARSCATRRPRPVYGGTEMFQNDPHWRDLILFYEYFHGDNGAGLGASHQTGWTGVVARLIQLFGHLDAGDPARRWSTAGPTVPRCRRQGPNHDCSPHARRPDATVGTMTGRGRTTRSSTRSSPGSGWPSWAARSGRRSPSADVPDDVWDDVARPGIDAVWLMGVWQRSPIGAAIARDQPGDARRRTRRAARSRRR